MFAVPEIVQLASAIEKEKILSAIRTIIHIEIQEKSHNHRHITICDITHTDQQIILPNYYEFILKNKVRIPKFNLNPFLAKLRLRELFSLPTSWKEIKEIFLNIPIKNLQTIKEYDLHFYFQCLDLLNLI